MNEQDRYGMIKAAEPIAIPQHSPFIASTLDLSPSPAATQAYHATVLKDLKTLREESDNQSD